MISIFKKKPTGNESAEQLAQLLADADATLATTRRSLAEAQAVYGEQVLGLSPAELTRADAQLAKLQAEEKQLQAARDALERRLSAAREHEAGQALAARWDACAAALEARHAAFAKVEQLAKELAAASLEAEKAAIAVWGVTPIREAKSPGGCGLEFNIEYANVLGMAHEAVDVAVFRMTAGTDHPRLGGETVWLLSKQPGIEQRSRESGDALLRYRSPTTTAASPEPSLPDAA